MPVLLAVDDSHEILALRESLLTLAGFSVITCADPMRALEWLRRTHVDILVTDYDMPGLNGVELSRLARASGFRGPIVMATANTSCDELDVACVNHVVAKAEAPKILLNTVQNCMKESSIPLLVPTVPTGSFHAHCRAAA